MTKVFVHGVPDTALVGRPLLKRLQLPAGGHARTPRLRPWVKSAPLVPGVGEILIPGEPEARLEAQRRRDGIPIEDETWRQIEMLAAELGVG
jgi:LDH2 family malate/lactate/ureidoglycolate dehydrogenase